MSLVNTNYIDTNTNTTNNNDLFDFVEDYTNRKFLQSAYRAITVCNLWEWMKTYNPNCNQGFILSSSNNLDILYEEMKKDEINDYQSGVSHASVMRAMEYIAKNGYDKYAMNYNK
jgi:hypothetical protein